MSAGYRTAPTGIYTLSFSDTVGAATLTVPFICPCDSTVLAITAGSSAHTGGTYGVQQGTLDIIGTAGNRAFPSTGTAEIVRGTTLSNKKITRGTTIKIIMIGGTSVTAGQITIVLRPEKQVNTSPTDDI